VNGFLLNDDIGLTNTLDAASCSGSTELGDIYTATRYGPVRAAR
jgi:hypothetical protein